MDIDPAIQQGALLCLKVFKLQFLLPYLDRLLRLADNKTLREELTAFPLAIRWVGGCCRVLPLQSVKNGASVSCLPTSPSS